VEGRRGEREGREGGREGGKDPPRVGGHPPFPNPEKHPVRKL